MVHRASESAKEQFQIEITIKTEVEVATTSAAHLDGAIDLNLKQEPGLVHSVKREPVLSVKEDILEDCSHDSSEQQCVQSAFTPVDTGCAKEACSMSLGNSFSVKPEAADIDVGPTLLQHMDIHYTLNKQNMDASRDENTVVDDCKEVMPGSGEKKETMEDKMTDIETTPHKYDGQAMERNINGEAHTESYPGQQNNFQHRAKSSNVFKCDTCRSSFHKPHLLRAHMRGHIGQTSLIISSAVAGTSQQSPDDKIKTKENLIKCEICGKRFSSKASLYNHKRLHSAVNNCVKPPEKPYQCDKCQSKFVRRDGLITHMKIHTGEKPYSCDVCGAKFIQNSGLKMHTRVHTGEKPYSCGTCGARFTHNSGLKIHTTVHTGERPHSCDMCGARFSQLSGLNMHMRVHTGEQPYECLTCHARFVRNNGLITHMRIHTGEKPYSCETCGKRFALNCALKKHKRVHTGEKPYRCDTCGAKFTQSGSLKMHIRGHTGEKPYQCDKCHVKYAQRRSLTWHMRVHTSQKL